ncbi:MAG: UDP-N-acetylmuramoyl-L-alanyl-D-glutamate--2,6-diaminopimelate ligase [Acidobacteriota bacterium]
MSRAVRLNQLLSQVEAKVVIEAAGALEDSRIRSLEYDSRRVSPGALFFAVSGQRTDGHLYLDQAVQRGAAAVASERRPPQGFPLPWLRVADVRKAMALLSDSFFGQASKRVRLVGITGTNGKTTTVHLIHSILNRQSPALMMGTVHTMIGDRPRLSHLTTPEAVEVQRTLAEAEQAGCRWGAIEVSSHALHRLRVFSCRFPVGVFTNLTQDHLDYHSTFEEYFEAKKLLFDLDYNPAMRWAVVCGDDRFASRIRPQGARQVIRFGLSSGNDVFPVSFDTSVAGSRMDLSFRGRRLKLKSRLAGEHNILNLMAAAAAASALGLDDEAVRDGIEALQTVPGRFERVEADHPATIFLDYAHTPDALEHVLKLCRKLAPRRVISLFGCGGDRDRAKRPQMGALSTRLADFSIITSDNPRSEPPERIVEDIQTGVPNGCSNFEAVVDRRQAIARALEIAGPEDILLLAGKGHEKTQEIQGEKHPFDEREIIRQAIEGRNQESGIRNQEEGDRK